MAMLSDFVAKMPLLINRLIEMNRIRDFVLLDPASHVANRAGLLRDLEREISRARRSNKAPLLVALKLVGFRKYEQPLAATHSAPDLTLSCGENC
jgi:GGDEF domain-containing protein